MFDKEYFIKSIKKVNKSELARRAGVSRALINKYLAGKCDLTLTSFEKIKSALEELTEATGK